MKGIIMKISNMFYMAYRNVITRKRVTRIPIISISISVFLILVFSSFQQGAVKLLNNEIDQNPELKQIQFYPMRKSDSEKEEPESNETLPISDDTMSALTQMEDIVAISDNYKYESNIESFCLDGKSVMVPEFISGRNVDYATFSKAEINSALSGNADFQPIVAGRDFRSRDRKVALIDEIAVKLLGIRDIRGILGKKIEITVNGETVTVGIIGVFSGKLGSGSKLNLTKEEYMAGFYTEDGKLDIGSQPVIVSSDVISELISYNKENNADADNGRYYLNIDITDIRATLEVYNYLDRKYMNFIFTPVESIKSMLSYLDTASIICMILGMILLFISIINVLSIMLVTIGERKKQFAVQNILGFGKRDIIFSISFESVMTGAIGTIIGMILSVLFSAAVDFFMSRQYRLYSGISSGAFTISLKIAIITVVVVLLLTAFAGILPALKIVKADPVKVISENQE